MLSASNTSLQRNVSSLFWGAIWTVCLVYTVFMAVLLCRQQSVDELHNFMNSLFSDTGRLLPEKFYAEDCDLYDEDHYSFNFNILLDKMDIFVPAHFFGWMIKALIIRDYMLLMVISIGFELLEYTLAPQLPNFGECWWDHWVLDALLCNGVGIWLGMRLAAHLGLKNYHWAGLWSSQVQRMRHSFLCFISVCLLVVMMLLSELNAFYMKALLWIPEDHKTVVGRHFLNGFIGFRAVGEVYDYLSSDRSRCILANKFTWLVLLSLLCELLVVLRHGWHIVSIPLHSSAYIGWGTGLVLFLLWTSWKFCQLHFTNKVKLQ